MKISYIFLCTLALHSLIITNNNFIQVTPEEQRRYEPFPLTTNEKYQPCNPTIAATGIHFFPHGRAYSLQGIIFNEKNEIQTDLIWPNNNEEKEKNLKLDQDRLPKPMEIDGTVVSLCQGGITCFYHFVAEVLGRLAMIEEQGIKYDYLFIPGEDQDEYYKFWYELLKLWGIDEKKIIEPFGATKHIQATMLIVPSLIDRVTPDLKPNLSSYISKKTIDQLRTKFLSHVTTDLITQKQFGKKIFISRQDAGTRRITNEDEVFAHLEKMGFQRYKLSELSIVEQICLFANADTIIGIHGAGLVNLIFANPKAEVIEIFQNRLDSTYWYLSQLLGIKKYTAIATHTDSIEDVEGLVDTTISQCVLEKILNIIQEQPQS